MSFQYKDALGEREVTGIRESYEKSVREIYPFYTKKLAVN